MEVFEDLKALFSEENNQKLSRDVLWKVNNSIVNNVDQFL